MVEAGMDNKLAQTTKLRRQVERVMDVVDARIGGPGEEFGIRFRGRLRVDPSQAYDQLEPTFEAEGLTLLFRQEQDAHVVLGLPVRIEPEPSNPWVNAGLFVVTVLSVIFAGAVYANANYYPDPVPADRLASLSTLLADLADLLPGGVMFASALMAILLAHEFGHYLAARHHRTAVTLPYLLPFPGSILGTLGAFIRMKEPPRNKRVLLDIGLAGPLSGFVVALPILLLGISLSVIRPLPSAPEPGVIHTLEGNSLIYLAAKYFIKGELLPAPPNYAGISPMLYWVRYFFTGKPVPFGGSDIIVHPLAWAGWAGLLVTALNLLPAGQLDGGHLIYVLIGRRAIRLWPLLLIGLVALGTFWPGWWIWAALIFFLGRTFATPLDELTPLDPRRRVLAISGLVLFLLTFSPIPLTTFAGG